MAEGCSCQLDSDYDGDCEFFSSEERTARKEHRCGECGDVIAPGERYEYYVGKGDGEFFTAKTCGPCAEVRDCFCCSYLFGGVWELITDSRWDMNLNGLDSISPEARAKFFEKVDLEEDEYED